MPQAYSHPSNAPVPKLGDRIQLHPATDHWMRGDRYGLVVGSYWSLKAPGIVSAWRVKLDKSGRVVKVHPDNVLEVLER